MQRARRYFSDAISAAPRYFPEATENLAEVDERLAAAVPRHARGARTPAGAITAAFGYADPLERAGRLLALPGQVARRSGRA